MGVGVLHDPPEEGLPLAFVAFNVAHFADFILDVPTPVLEDVTHGRELCEVHHYSNRISLPSKNRLYAIKY